MAFFVKWRLKRNIEDRKEMVLDHESYLKQGVIYDNLKSPQRAMRREAAKWYK